MKLWHTALDLVYPRSCAGCGGEAAEGSGSYLCWECRRTIPLVRLPYCARCGDPVEGRIDEAFVCHGCAQHAPAFDLARSAARYRAALKELILQFKYNRALWLRADLAELLAACGTAYPGLFETDAVTFVPMHFLRRIKRGYNQARLLAETLARRLDKPLVPVLWRVRPTGTQTRLSARQRALNIRGAFHAVRPGAIAGRRWLLVDDVMTSGATVNECARALKNAGAARVHVVTVARG